MNPSQKALNLLDEDLVADRVTRCDEIIAILTTSISKLKRRKD